MIDSARERLKHDLRTFGAGAACGFVGGAFAASLILWHYGGAIAPRLAMLQHVRGVPGASDPWKGGLDDAGAGVVEPGGRAIATTGTPPAGAGELSPDEMTTELRSRHLQMPVDGVRPDQLIDQFHDLRGGSRPHEALDILAPRNMPVRAVEDGVIARLFYSKAGGNTVYQFDPSERYCYYYAHLERYAEGLSEGQRVRRGDVIGFVGTSGNAPKDTPHLHFAVFRLTPEKHWWEGTPIDPFPILR